MLCGTLIRIQKYLIRVCGLAYNHTFPNGKELIRQNILTTAIDESLHQILMKNSKGTFPKILFERQIPPKRQYMTEK